jgi:predicted CXXCH cytochrome family protein
MLMFALLGALPAAAANHPPLTSANASCSSCHADMLQGASVHSQGEIECTTCHASTPDGGKVAISLTVPKDQLCYACHERGAMQQHWATPKRGCLDCHDAHHSTRAMLLKRNVDVTYSEPTGAVNENVVRHRAKPRRAAAKIAVSQLTSHRP